jgi:hypothetical protein
MKAKQIEKLLTGVMNNFLESISDNYIKDIIKNNSYITGGCIPSMLIDEFVNDYDIYFYTKEDADGVKKYFETAHTKNKDDKFHVKLITDNAINLSDKIQLITKFWGDPSFVTDEFDWQHIKSWYSCKEEKLYLTSDVYQLVVEKELIYTGSDYPLSSLMRLKKYIKKGWNVSNTTMLHIALDIVASFNKMEAERQFEQTKHNKEILEKIGQKIANMPQEEFDELIETSEKRYDNDTEEEQEFEIITDPVELDYINKMNKANKQQTFNVNDIIYHMNGVDPIRIQDELVKKTGQYLSIGEIIKIIKGE